MNNRDDSDSSLSMAFPLKKLISSFLPIFSPTTIVNLSEPPCVRYKSIISFGDSSADTGNFLSLSDDINHPPQAAFLPYGETFFHPPSGRYFDCRLIIDFIGNLYKTFMQNRLLYSGLGLFYLNIKLKPYFLFGFCNVVFITWTAEFLAVADPGLNFTWVKPCKKNQRCQL